MGGGPYDESERSYRAISAGYHKKAASEIFTQSEVRRIHDSMLPSKALLRESRDSQVNPITVPIIMGLDLTGSMGDLPMYLIRDGLPTMVTTIIQRGVPSPAILFLGIGDHEYDKAPLQVGQFESGDAELDMWLTRTWLEGRGGPNGGESYLLAWYFAAMHTVTDAWEKRKEKGFIFTIGDEPCLPHLPAASVKEIMGVSQGTSYTAPQLLKLAQEKYHVYHLNMSQGSNGSRAVAPWRTLLGQNLIEVDDYTQVAKTIAEIVTSNVNIINKSVLVDTKQVVSEEKVSSPKEETAYWKETKA